jgi:hypothetical protein
MAVVPFTKEQIERTQAELRSELRLVTGPGEESPVPVNQHLVEALKGDETLYYRGRRFKVRAFGFIEGARLSVLETRYSNLTVKEKARNAQRESGGQVELNPADLREMLDVLEDTIALFRDLVVPRGWFERLLWPLLKNPFENATEQEIGELLGFFFVCRMKSGVRFESPRRQGKRGRTTSVTSLLPS